MEIREHRIQIVQADLLSKKILIISDNITSEHYNINGKNKTSTSKIFIHKQGNCKKKEKLKLLSQYLNL